MAVIAASLKRHGHNVQQFDYLVAERSIERLRKKVQNFSPDFVAISLRNIDNVDSLTSDQNWFLAEARTIVKTIREISSAPIIVGGPGFSLLPEEILTYLGADYGIVGEGERVICNLISKLEKRLPTPKIIKGRHDCLAESEIGGPWLESELVDYYISRSGLANLQTKRGCPHSCAYCSYPTLEGTKIRARDPKEVVFDIERMVKKYQIEHIFFTDSVFNDMEGHYLQLAEEIVRSNLSIRWCAFFRPYGMGEKHLALLKRSGLYAMEIGTDAAADVTLRGLNKKFGFNDVIAFNDMCVRAEIPCAHFVIFGGPEETNETIDEGLSNIEKLSCCVVFAFSGIRILPNTRLYRRAVQEGIIKQDTSLLKPIFYFSPNINPQIMNEKIEKAFRGRRDRIFPPSKGQQMMEVLHRFGYRGILWDTLISYKKNKGRPL